MNENILKELIEEESNIKDVTDQCHGHGEEKEEEASIANLFKYLKIMLFDDFTSLNQLESITNADSKAFKP
jgi:hypothetical protein